MKLWQAMERNDFAILFKDEKRGKYTALSASGKGVTCDGTRLEIRACDDWYGTTIWHAQLLSDEWQAISEAELNDIMWKKSTETKP